MYKTYHTPRHLIHEHVGFASGLLFLLLALLGMTGAAYHALRPGGFLEPLLSSVVGHHPVLGFFLVLAVGSVVMAVKGQLYRREGKPREAFLYFWVALGTVFAYRLLAHGGF